MKFSVVTPSLDQARYLEEAMRSVLEQGCPDLEYVVVDGGSTDGSREILERYQSRLAYWRSRPDEGHTAALDEGFGHTSGEVMCWLNADDAFVPSALSVVADIFTTFPEVRWLTSGIPLQMDERSRVVRGGAVPGYSGEAFRRGLHTGSLFGAWLGPMIQQESTFWRRDLWEEAGSRLDSSFRLAADFELWHRFFRHAELYTVDAPLGCFRMHAEQRTATALDGYRDEVRRLVPAPARPLRDRALRVLGEPVRSRLRLGSEVPFISWHTTRRAWQKGRRHTT